MDNKDVSVAGAPPLAVSGGPLKTLPFTSNKGEGPSMRSPLEMAIKLNNYLPECHYLRNIVPRWKEQGKEV